MESDNLVDGKSFLFVKLDGVGDDILDNVKGISNVVLHKALTGQHLGQHKGTYQEQNQSRLNHFCDDFKRMVFYVFLSSKTSTTVCLIKWVKIKQVYVLRQ